MVAKIAHNLANTNLQQAHYGKCPLCPCCQSTDKIVKHILWCTQRGYADSCIWDRTVDKPPNKSWLTSNFSLGWYHLLIGQLRSCWVQQQWECIIRYQKWYWLWEGFRWPGVILVLLFPEQLALYTPMTSLPFYMQNNGPMPAIGHRKPHLLVEISQGCPTGTHTSWKPTIPSVISVIFSLLYGWPPSSASYEGGLDYSLHSSSLTDISLTTTFRTSSEVTVITTSRSLTASTSTSNTMQSSGSTLIR